MKALLGVVLLLAGIAGASTEPQDERHAVRYGSRSIRVKAGQSVQEAIDGARAGDTVTVDAGVYAERLLIKKGITLVGNDATLVPPSASGPNDCSNFCGDGSEAGICVAGNGIRADAFVTEHQKIRSVSQPVVGVTIQGFHVKGFEAGPSILVIGAQDTKIKQNRIDGGANAIYGFLSAGSRNTVLADNTITSLPDPSSFSFVGACNDNFQGTEVRGNTVSGWFVGFCVQTSGSHFCDNKAEHCCAGAFLDPYVDGVSFENNQITNSYPACGDFGAWGIFVDGASNSQIDHNEIKGISNSIGPSAGIAVVDESCASPSLSCASDNNQPSPSKNNQIAQNRLFNNTLDLSLSSTGSGNVFRQNVCKTSSPAGLCGKK